MSVGKRRVIWMPAAALLLAGMAPAQERRPRVDVDSINLEAEINPRTQSINATATVRFVPLEDRQQSAVFELNNALQVSKVVDGTGRQIPTSRANEEFSLRVNFPEPMEKGKPQTLIFTYDGRLTGAEDSPVYGIKFAAIKEDITYLMYPARWFPVSDYTVDRFSSTMKVAVPAGYKVLGSGLSTTTQAGDRTVYEMNYQRPGFPGSLAIVKGEGYRSTNEGVTTLLYFRGDNAAMASVYGGEVSKMVTLLTNLYGVPPQTGLTVVETEDGTPRGYAAPGMLFLNSKAIGKEPNPRLLANQIARQWWGVEVSPASRNHIWIVNAAARYAELYWVEQTAGQAALESDLRDTYIEALTVGEPPVMQAARIEDYSPEYWAVTGAKGAAVLSMLRYTMGDEAFFKLMKDFPVQYAWKSATTEDFRKAAEAASGRNLQGFFIQWIESTGAPEFKAEYTVFRRDNGFRIMGKITQDLDTFRMPVEVQIETEGNPELKTVEVVGTSSEFVIDTFGKPRRIVIDPKTRVLRMDDKMKVAVAIRRGEMFMEISEFGEALKEYQKALDVNRNSSLAHYRAAEVHLFQRIYQQAANAFREALNGDLEPKWVEVWAHISLGNIFDITGDRERAVNEYNLAIRTKDNTQGAQEVAAKYLKEPYQRPAVKEN